MWRRALRRSAILGRLAGHATFVSQRTAAVFTAGPARFVQPAQNIHGRGAGMIVVEIIAGRGELRADRFP
jgi:hypothetical protein